MLTDREILKLANESYNEFLTNFLVECQFEVVPLNKFLHIAEKNKYFQDLLNKKQFKSIKEMYIPIVTISGEKFKIIFCNLLLNRILARFSKEKQKLFIKAITLHELYHIINQSEKRELNIYNIIRSDSLAHKEFKEDFPQLTKLLDECKKRFKKYKFSKV